MAVCPEDDEARDLALELEAILGRAAVALYPSRGVPLAGPVGASPHLVGQRARALASAERPETVVVAGAPALAELIAPREVWPAPLGIAAGTTTPIEQILDRLAELGYERTAQVEERGEVAVRGGLIDVYPSTADLPVRIEFFGDEIESVRAFSPFTQRTIRPLARVLVWPSTEPEAEHARTGPLDDTRLAAAVLVRLAPNEHVGALRTAPGAVRRRGRRRCAVRCDGGGR